MPFRAVLRAGLNVCLISRGMEFQIEGALENDLCRNVWVLTCGICRALEQTKREAVLMEGSREDQPDKQGLYQRKGCTSRSAR